MKQHQIELKLPFDQLQPEHTVIYQTAMMPDPARARVISVNGHCAKLSDRSVIGVNDYFRIIVTVPETAITNTRHPEFYRNFIRLLSGRAWNSISEIFRAVKAETPKKAHMPCRFTMQRWAASHNIPLPKGDPVRAMCNALEDRKQTPKVSHISTPNPGQAKTNELFERTEKILCSFVADIRRARITADKCRQLIELMDDD